MKIEIRSINGVTNSIQAVGGIGGHESMLKFNMENFKRENLEKIQAILEDELNNNMGLDALAEMLGQI